MANPRWVNIGDHVKEIGEETWSAYWAEMGGDESLEFLKDPKPTLIQQGLIDESFRIQSHTVNADVSTIGDPVCRIMLIFPKEKLVLITDYRHPH